MIALSAFGTVTGDLSGWQAERRSRVSVALNQPPGCDVPVAAVQSVAQTSALHRRNLIADLHEAKGVGDNLHLGAVTAFLDLRRTNASSVFGLTTSMDPPSVALRFDEPSGCTAKLYGVNGLELASPTCASWNQLERWLRAVDGLRQAAR
jgi:hypothetical protein